MLRRQLARTADGIVQGYTNLWEVSCPTCGEDANVDRGPYTSREEGEAALDHHIGANTELAQLYYGENP